MRPILIPSKIVFSQTIDRFSFQQIWNSKIFVYCSIDREREKKERSKKGRKNRRGKKKEKRDSTESLITK